MALSTFDLGSFIPYVAASVRARLERRIALELLFVDRIDLDELVDEATQQALLYADELASSVYQVTSEVEPLAIVRMAVRRAVLRVCDNHWIADRPIKQSKARNCQLDKASDEPSSDNLSAQLVEQFERDLSLWITAPETCKQIGLHLAAWRMRHQGEMITLDISERLGKNPRDVCALINKAQRAVERFAEEWLAERIR